MHVTLVHVYVKEGHLEAFISATQQNHEASVHEAGNQRFDVLQDPKDPTHFILYEAYQTEADAFDHKKTTHYLTWRDAVAEMMDKPREGVPMQGLFPR
jgi:(4S)-4-hydroxy-5-phosphonooxypentane-2,3-dione isomerase